MPSNQSHKWSFTRSNECHVLVIKVYNANGYPSIFGVFIIAQQQQSISVY